MSRLGTGLTFASLASLIYAAAVTAQALEARRVDQRHILRLSLLARLVRRPLWLTGATVGMLGWVAQAAALSRAPITLVEPVLGSSIIVLLASGAFMLGERVRAREAVAALTIIIGITGTVLAAPPHSTHHSQAPRLAVVLGGLLAIVAVPQMLRRTRWPESALLAVSAGSAYATVAITTKILTDDVSTVHWRAAAGWAAATAVIATAGVVSEMSALQTQPVTRVAPIVFGLNIAVPVALAPVLAGEQWPTGFFHDAALVGSLVSVLAAVIVLCRARLPGSILVASDLSPSSSRPAATLAAE